MVRVSISLELSSKNIILNPPRFSSGIEFRILVCTLFEGSKDIASREYVRYVRLLDSGVSLGLC